MVVDAHKHEAVVLRGLLEHHAALGREGQAVFAAVAATAVPVVAVEAGHASPAACLALDGLVPHAAHIPRAQSQGVDAPGGDAGVAGPGAALVLVLVPLHAAHAAHAAELALQEARRPASRRAESRRHLRTMDPSPVTVVQEPRDSILLAMDLGRRTLDAVASPPEELRPAAHLAPLQPAGHRREAPVRGPGLAPRHASHGRPSQSSVGSWNAGDAIRRHDLVLEDGNVPAVDPVVEVAELEIALRGEVVVAHEDHQGLPGVRVHLEVAPGEPRRHPHAEVLVVPRGDPEFISPFCSDHDVHLAVLAGGAREVAVALTDTVLPAVPVARAEGVSLRPAAQRADS
mmetsp:Transcript_120860/g.353118  ORF Transcript_120860/g.353118 Transcript_120860/m.353118 type:complete len:344 (-) Transcript_120860:493-1524(-)